jgi:hypothetical protein
MFLCVFLFCFFDRLRETLSRTLSNSRDSYMVGAVSLLLPISCDRISDIHTLHLLLDDMLAKNAFHKAHLAQLQALKKASQPANYFF